MPLIHLVRDLFPTYYWSAGFIACLFVVFALAGTLYIVTRWSPWIVVSLSALVYMIPFFLSWRGL